MLLSDVSKKMAKDHTNSHGDIRQPKGPNYVTLRLSIMDRNLFNSDGEYPDESDLENNVEERKENQVFDPHAKCQKSALKLTLLGTIYIANSNDSLATIKEDGFNEADIYRVGDSIAGFDEASVVAIDRKKVVLNNGGNKECIEVEEKALVRDDNTYFEPGTSPRDSDMTKPAEIPITPESESGDCVNLQNTFVEKELGDGFAKIVNSARLVPNMEENQVVGFKIFAIQSSSILGQVGLKNGDIITQVNDVSLKQPEQGFALYEAFQNERDINIHVLRGGKSPKTLCVKIK